MANINEDIRKNEYKPVYLIYGTENYLRENYRKKLVKALVKEGDNLNFSHFSGNEADIDEIVSLAQTMPFMAEKRVVLIRNSGFFKNSCDGLHEYLSAPSPDCVLIFDEEAVDKRGKNYKAAEKLDGLAEAKSMTGDELKRWIAALLQRNGKKIRESSAELIITRVGSDMSILNSELNKLIGYTGDREVITDEDIYAITFRNPSNNIFQMIDAVALKKRSEAISLYYDMLASKEKPAGILALLERHFRILMIVKEMSENRADSAAIAKGASIPAFAVGKYRSQASRYSRTKLKEILDACVQAETDSRQGKIKDTLAVELILIKYSA